jgi:HK97 family phage major capsid protein
MDSPEMRRKRAQLIEEARGLLNRADNGVLGAEDQAQYDKLFAEAEGLAKSIRAIEALDTAAQAVPPVTATADMRTGSTGEQATNEPTAQRATPEYAKAFSTFLRGGWGALGPADQRALQSDLNTSGGYLVTPMQFVNDLIKGIDNQVLVRQWATTYQVPTAQALGVPSLEADPADPTWTAEIATGDEDSTMAFGRRELHPHPLAKRIKVSNKLLRQIPNVEQLVNDRLAYKFAVTMEQAYMTGTGAGQPLGLFVASADGITTARDVATDNSATGPTANGLINAKFTLKPQYWLTARWLFHRDTVKVISKLTDGNGDFLWRTGIVDGEPDMLLGLPVFMSEYAPNTLTANQYVGVLGDFRYYWIADALDMQVQRLVELYAATNQIGLIGRMESDGAPVLAEAFVRIKNGS